MLISITGTKGGDPIETNAAGKVFSKGRDAQKPLRCVSERDAFLSDRSQWYLQSWKRQSKHWTYRRMQFLGELGQSVLDVAPQGNHSKHPIQQGESQD